MGGASRLAQTNALFRKNLVIQRRACKTNCCLICFPFLICLLFGGTQTLVAILYMRSIAHLPPIDCQHCTAHTNATVSEDTVGGLLCPTQCPQPIAPKWPPLLQLPRSTDRAVKDGLFPFNDLPDSSCRSAGSCAGTFLVTGSNQSFAGTVMGNMFPEHTSLNLAAGISTLADHALGTDAWPVSYFDPDGYGADFNNKYDRRLYFLQNKCTPNSTLSFAVQEDLINYTKNAKCTEGLLLWRENSSVMNNELYRGYYLGNNENKTNEIASAYDLTRSDLSNFNLVVSYNSTYNGGNQIPALMLSVPPNLLRVPRLLNLVSNAYLQLWGSGTKMLFEFVKDMPREAQPGMPLDISFFVGKLVFMWIIMLLFPVILSNLVYEKQQKLRTMMKMHGLGDIAYWTISYFYFLLLSLFYMLFLVLFGSTVGIKLFRLNSYSVQFVFYFAYINLQISFAFLMAAYFSNVKTATVTGYLYIIGAGLLGEYLFRPFVEDISLPRTWITLMEFFPPFSLYRILYEFSPPIPTGNYMDFSGLQWTDLSDLQNGMLDVLIIMVVEWFMFLILVFCFDEFGCFHNAIRKVASFCHLHSDGKSFRAAQQQTIQLQEFKTSVGMESADVIREREIVEQLLQEPNNSYSVICDNLKKVYHGKDGNEKKTAVRGLSLSMPRGQCFGVLGPNGAGKTTLINMLTGFTKPTSGAAYVEGMDIQLDMDKIYTIIGVCPQHDLLWETLTAREHLLFYGRLKKLKGAALAEAIEQSLRRVRLFDGGIADRRVEKYSGGMKRRLSVAISLIGDPKVVYMDEPSSGLDPASRKDLWSAVKAAKQDRAIILTTHSMEEAEVLCDRIGIIANGGLQCIGNSKELKAKHGGTFVLTVTTAPGEEKEVERLVRFISASANRVYRISGTQKFEMPKQEVRISQVFQAMEYAKSRLTILAWGLADTTLEDVFITVAKQSEASSMT